MLTVTSVTIMAPAPRDLAQFYAKLLDAEVTALDPPRPGDPDEAGWAQIRTSTVRLNFEWERAWTPPRWPAEPTRQLATQHLDIHVDNLESAVAHALTCGARLAEHQPQDDVRVMLDPSGHSFCLYV